MYIINRIEVSTLVKLRRFEIDGVMQVEDFDSLFKRFKKQVQQNRVIEEYRKRQYFTKKSMKRKLKQQEHLKLVLKIKNKNRKRNARKRQEFIKSKENTNKESRGR